VEWKGCGQTRSRHISVSLFSPALIRSPGSSGLPVPRLAFLCQTSKILSSHISHYTATFVASWKSCHYLCCPASSQLVTRRHIASTVNETLLNKAINSNGNAISNIERRLAVDRILLTGPFSNSGPETVYTNLNFRNSSRDPLGK
jgi:hypothetical protein